APQPRHRAATPHAARSWNSIVTRSRRQCGTTSRMERDLVQREHAWNTKDGHMRHNSWFDRKPMQLLEFRTHSPMEKRNNSAAPATDVVDGKGMLVHDPRDREPEHRNKEPDGCILGKHRPAECRHGERCEGQQ